MNALALALLYLTGGSPHDLDGPDFEAGCYLGMFEGGESRLVYDGPASVPFHVGTPGTLKPSGAVTVTPGVHGRTDVTVHAAQVFRVNATCDVPDLHAADPLTAAAQLTLVVGDVFVFLDAGCDDDGVCRAEHKGKEFTMIDGTCDVVEVPTPPSTQVGWWVPAQRGDVAGWVRGDTGFHVESRCYGPDEGAPLNLLRWHRR